MTTSSGPCCASNLWHVRHDLTSVYNNIMMTMVVGVGCEEPRALERANSVQGEGRCDEPYTMAFSTESRGGWVGERCVKQAGIVG
jgi:hypothetical protein